MTTIESKNGGGDMSEPPQISTSSTPDSTQNEIRTEMSKEKDSIWRRIYTILTWTPPSCRWDPAKPPQFSMSMNVLFAFAAGCTSLSSIYQNIT
jgi:hypothetical protein